MLKNICSYYFNNEIIYEEGLIYDEKLFYNGDIITLEDELYAEAVLVQE